MLLNILLPFLFRRILSSWVLVLVLSGLCLGDAVPRSPVDSLSGVVDLAGSKVNPLGNSVARAVVLVFVHFGCPISNRYAPEIQRIQQRFSKDGVDFWLVVPDAEESAGALRNSLREFGYHMGLIRDPDQSLVRLSQVAVTPEVAVFLPGGQLVYHGRIDNRHADFGCTRPVPTRRDLVDVLESIRAGKPVPFHTSSPVGCSIPPLNP